MENERGWQPWRQSLHGPTATIQLMGYHDKIIKCNGKNMQLNNSERLELLLAHVCSCMFSMSMNHLLSGGAASTLILCQVDKKGPAAADLDMAAAAQAATAAAAKKAAAKEAAQKEAAAEAAKAANATTTAPAQDLFVKNVKKLRDEKTKA